jgi:hypothetical protein
MWIFVEDSLSLSRQCNSGSERMEYDRKKEGKINVDCELVTSLVKIFISCYHFNKAADFMLLSIH